MLYVYIHVHCSTQIQNSHLWNRWGGNSMSNLEVTFPRRHPGSSFLTWPPRPLDSMSYPEAMSPLRHPGSSFLLWLPRPLQDSFLKSVLGPLTSISQCLPPLSHHKLERGDDSVSVLSGLSAKMMHPLTPVTVHLVRCHLTRVSMMKV